MVYFSATEKSDTSSVSIISPRISAGSILNSIKDGVGPISGGELLFFHHEVTGLRVIRFECVEYGDTNLHQKNVIKVISICRYQLPRLWAMQVVTPIQLPFVYVCISRFFYQLFCCPKVNAESLMRGHPHSPDFYHWVITITTRSLPGAS